MKKTSIFLVGALFGCTTLSSKIVDGDFGRDFGWTAPDDSANARNPAAVLGDYSFTRNYPGYMTFDPKAQTNKASKTPGKDHVETRTPSLLLKSFLTQAGRLDPAKIQAEVQRIHTTEARALAETCRKTISDLDAKNPERKNRVNVSALCREERGSSQIYSSLQRYNADACQYPETDEARIACSWLSDKDRIKFVTAEKLILKARDLATNLVIREETLNTAAVQEFTETLFAGLEITESTIGNDASRGSLVSNLIGGTLNVMRPASIRVDRKHEAVNLVIPENQRAFLGLKPDELFADPTILKSKSIDLALFDPNESGLWRPVRDVNTGRVKPISDFDTRNYDGRIPPGWIPAIEDETKPLIATFDGLGGGGGKTPKFNIKIKDSKPKYKVKFANYLNFRGSAGIVPSFSRYRLDNSELYTETAVNNLAAALGFTVNPTVVRKNVRVYLPDDKFSSSAKAGENLAHFNSARDGVLNQFRKASSSADDWGVGESLKASAQPDSDGRFYIDLPLAAIEQRDYTEGSVQVGMFVKKNFGRIDRREHRAAQLFHMWIGDWDTKDDNVDIKIVKTNDPSHPERLAYSLSDMGASLSVFLTKDKVNLFSANLVNNIDAIRSGTEHNEIKLNYRTPYKLSIVDSLTLADARWMLFRMNQLTREQINHAFLAAKYHPAIAYLYTEKLLNRRDQLSEAVALLSGRKNEFKKVSAFDSQGHLTHIPGEFRDLISASGKLTQCRPGMSPSQCDATDFHPTQETPYSNQMVGGMIAGAAAAGKNFLIDRIRSVELARGVGFIGGPVNVGTQLQSFAPLSYYVENPDKGSQMPWWQVDHYRFVISARVPDPFSSSFFASSRLQAGIFKVYEFIRLRPSANKNVFMKPVFVKIKDGLKMEGIITAFKGFQEEMVENLGKGEKLVTSHYLGGQVAGGGGPAGIFPVGNLAIASAELAKISRAIILKEDESAPQQVTVAWEKLNKKLIKGQGGFKIPGINTFIAGEVEKKGIEDLAYRFDMNNKEHRDALFATMNSFPTEVKFNEKNNIAKVMDKETQVTSKRGLLSLFKVLTKGRVSETHVVKDKIGSSTVVMKSDESGSKTWRFIKESGFRVESIDLDGRGDLTGSVRFFHEEKYAKKPELLKVLDKYLPLLLKDTSRLVAFDAKEMENWYLGTLTFDATVTFKEGSLGQILSSNRPVYLNKGSEESVCSLYARGLPFYLQFQGANASEFSTRWCQLIANKGIADGGGRETKLNHIGNPLYKELLNGIDNQDQRLAVQDGLIDSIEFLQAFDAAQKSFQKTDAANLKTRKSALGKINALLRKTNSGAGVLHTLIGLADQKNVVTQIKLSSSLGGLAGNFELELKDGDGKSATEIAQGVNNLFVDRYFRYLADKEIFFDPNRERSTRIRKASDLKRDVPQID